ncbi:MULTISPECIES: FadR/GntR family transcriptional regulator [unclassified Cryobacterium]|uniref:FadR/GntR family transcriptional regulator n=1 Tax=unclassified Cryobacterium TaxID=2649013 RepID=UPI00106C6C88|nr:MULTISPECIES: FadR/GntR family transcriptional regulator [unclassified Cryobacterium]TFD05855.1 FadR family transcriptional regulator [Cryobacterium sp. TMT1-66-1]TFD09946.1 FadR family transcriptional regulator [Cryobacterium sp. TMT1-2-2]
MNQSWSGRLSTPDGLVVRIERLILSRELASGSKLPPERELAAILGVSRSSLRDALRALEVRRMVRRQPGIGTIITDPGATPHGNVLASGLDIAPSGLDDIMDVRACIEPPIASRAATRASITDIANLHGLISEMTLELTPGEYGALDRVFHRSIALAAQNPLLLRLLDRVNEIIEPSRGNALLTIARQRSSIAEHQQIVKAIAARDSEGAYQAAAVHVESVLAHIAKQQATRSNTSSPSLWGVPDA